MVLFRCVMAAMVPLAGIGLSLGHGGQVAELVTQWILAGLWSLCTTACAEVRRRGASTLA